ncbi:MAG: MBL fold metallo-hydrolase [Gemmatimonadaceae bacterium]
MKRANDDDAPLHHRPGGGFRNPWPAAAPHGTSGFLKWMLTRSRRKPLVESAPIRAKALKNFPTDANKHSVAWVGHSTFLIQLSGLNILTDPIWSERASPISFAGPRRLVPPGFLLEQLPEIHATLLSHDHYDHLDDVTVRYLIRRFPSMQWLVPLGVAEFLVSRGATAVTELDWWELTSLGGATFSCTPAQHFSGRFPWSRNATLWCGWAVRSPEKTVFFAGDTALHPDFEEITRRFGPFDVSILPIGAYDPRWFMHNVHMDPSEAVKAFVAMQNTNGLAGGIMVGSHWGTFRLTDEPIDEPPFLARQSWAEAGLVSDRLWILSAGETRTLG